MKHVPWTFILPILWVSVFSCKKDNDMDPVAVTGGALSAEIVEMSPTGDEFLLSFTSDKAWTLSQTVPDDYPRWLIVDRQSGNAGTGVISLSAPLNDLRMDRETRLTFNAKDGTYATNVLVKQTYPYLIAALENAQSVPEISLTYDYDEYIGAGMAADRINISSNVTWGVMGEEESAHFNISPLEGEGDGAVLLFPSSPNFGKAPHTYEFDIVPLMENYAGDGYTEIPEVAADHFHVSMFQDNFLFLLDNVVNDINVSFSDMNDIYELTYLTDGSDEPMPGRDGDVPVSISIEAEKPWHVHECPAWISTNVRSGQNLTFEIAADGVNPTRQDRSGTIVLMPDEETRAIRNIAVVQEGYLFEMESDELDGNMTVEIAADDFEVHSMTLHTRGPWKILDLMPDWLDITPTSYQGKYSTSGISSHDISFRALDKNLEFDDRAADIVFSRTVKPVGMSEDPLDMDVRIVQKAFVFDVLPSPVLGEIPFLNTLPYQVEITCSGPWKIDSVPDWLNIPETSGEAGTTVIWVNAKTANPYEDRDRSAVVEVVSVDHENAGRNVRRSFEVLQRKYTFELIPGPDIRNIPAYKAAFPTYSANLQCSAPWEITVCPEWLSPDVTSGDGMEDVVLSFVPQVNSSESARSGTVAVRDSYKGRELSFEAVQDGFVFDGSPVSFDDIPVMNTLSYTVTFSLTAEAPWEVVSHPAWTNPSQLSGTAYSHGEATVNFVPEPNPELSRRSGIAVIRSKVNNGEKQVTFDQEPFEFDDSPESYEYTELDDKSESFHVKCSGPWSVDAPSWVKFSPSSGSSSATVSVSVTANTTLDERKADCRLISSLNGLVRNISIVQDAFEFDSEALSFSFGTIDDTEETFDIICSGSWTARNVPSWIELSASRGSGNENADPEEITLGVEDNMGVTDRKTVIAFTSDDNPSLVKNVTVTQAAFVFEVSPQTCGFGSGAGDERITVECSGEWTASCTASWVDISSVRTGSFEISVDENESDTERRATVTVRSTMNGLTKDILVTQAAGTAE